MSYTEKDFNELFEQTKSTIYSYIAAHCRSVSDIDDVFQDTYFGVYSFLHGGGTVNDPLAFTRTVARRTLAKYYISLSRPAPDPPREQAPPPQSEAADRINSLILKSPPKIQRIFFLRHTLGLSFPEIAAELGMRTNTVQKCYYKKVAEIRRRLEKEGLM